MFHGVMVALEFLVLSVIVRIGVEQHPLPPSPALLFFPALRRALLFQAVSFRHSFFLIPFSSISRSSARPEKRGQEKRQLRCPPEPGTPTKGSTPVLADLQFTDIAEKSGRAEGGFAAGYFCSCLFSCSTSCSSSSRLTLLSRTNVFTTLRYEPEKKFFTTLPSLRCP